MSYQVDIDTSGLKETLAKVEGALGEFPEMIGDFLDDRVVPVLEAEAASQRKVRTGTYSGTFEVQIEVDGASVTTEAYYWVFLEYGTSRGIKPKPVVGEAVLGMVPDLAVYLGTALEELIE
jgi:hypothetical protein